MNNEVNNLFKQAVSLFSSGELKRSEDICLNLLKLNSDYPDLYNLLAIIKNNKGDIDQAIKYMEKAVSLDPEHHLYNTNLGEFYKRIGDIEKAIYYLKRSIEINPEFHGSKYNLANIYKTAGYKKEAEQLYREAIAINPHDYQSFQNLGNLYQEEGKHLEAAECYFSALNINPTDFELEANLARSFLDLKNYFQSEYYFKNVLAQKPDHLIALKTLAVVLENQGRYEEGTDFYKKYINASKEDPKELNLAKQLHLDMTMPAFDLTKFEINTFREKILKSFDKYRFFYDDTKNYEFANENVHMHSQLAYHGLDNLEIKSKYAAIFKDAFKKYEVSFNSGKIKIGFLVTKTHEGIFSKYIAGIINHLPESEFEIYLICEKRGWEKTIKERVKNEKLIKVIMAEKLEDAAEQIFNIKLDILYHWEIGTDSFNYFLPFIRLAPVQVTSVGWPDTSGIPTIDYFISGELIETGESDKYYSEKLIRFKKLPLFHQKPELTEPLTPFEEFNIESGKNIYLCSQNLRKLHPDLDILISNILRKDQNGVVVFVKHEHERISELLKLRIKISNPDIADRVIFLNRLSYNQYLSLIHHSHVLLDSLYYGGANTAYEAFAMNRPVVTLPWTHERSRYTLGCYKYMGIEGCIAGNFEEYVSIAVKLANDPDFRNNIISQIEAKNHLLFNDMNLVQEYIEFFKKVADRPHN